MGFTGKRVFVVGMLASAAGLAACASRYDKNAIVKPIDGSTFAVSVKPEGQEPVPDRLIFSSGKFESTICTRAGFLVSDYAATPEGSGLGFSVGCDSPTMGHNEWHGIVVGDHIEGVLVRTPNDGSGPVRSAFSGDRVR